MRRACRAKPPSSGWCRLPSSSVITTSGTTTSCSAKRSNRPRVRQEHRGVQDECLTGDAGHGWPGSAGGRTGPLPRGSGCVPARPVALRFRGRAAFGRFRCRLPGGAMVRRRGLGFGVAARGLVLVTGCSGGRAPSVRGPRRPGPRRGRVRPHPWSGLGDREIPGHTQTLTGRPALLGQHRSEPTCRNGDRTSRFTQARDRVRWCAPPRRARRCRPRRCAGARASGPAGPASGTALGRGRAAASQPSTSASTRRSIGADPASMAASRRRRPGTSWRPASDRYTFDRTSVGVRITDATAACNSRRRRFQLARSPSK